MLRRSYDNTVIGMNYVSLIHSIISLKLDKSVLVIDSNNSTKLNHWFQNIGELEKLILNKIGTHYDIECLKNIDLYLSAQNTLLLMDDLFLELSDSPYTNIKEIARKLPECFAKTFNDTLGHITQAEFDSQFANLVDTIAEKSSSLYVTKNIKKAFEASGTHLAEIFNSFLSYLEQDTLTTKQLHYVLQVAYQTVFSSSRDELESKYLLLSLISPRYKVDNQKLMNELLYEFRKLGGDLKATSIHDWGIENNKLKYLLLNSIDGLTKSSECYYFGGVTELSRFETHNNQRRFFSIQVDCLIDHSYVEFYQDKRIIFSNKKRMGSDFPFWEVTMDGLGNLCATYSYADNLGTKANFYYHHALEDIYQSLVSILPGLDKEDWLPRAKVSMGQNVWVEYHPSQKEQLHPDHEFKVNKLYLQDDSKVIGGLHYCGVDRAKSMGLYTYILDIFSPSGEDSDFDR